MDFEKIPDLRSEQWPKRVTFSVDEETHWKLQFLKKHHKKDPSGLCRALVAEFLEENKELFENKEGILPGGN